MYTSNFICVSMYYYDNNFPNKATLNIFSIIKGVRLNVTENIFLIN